MRQLYISSRKYISFSPCRELFALKFKTCCEFPIHAGNSWCIGIEWGLDVWELERHISFRSIHSNVKCRLLPQRAGNSPHRADVCASGCTALHSVWRMTHLGLSCRGQPTIMSHSGLSHFEWCAMFGGRCCPPFLIALLENLWHKCFTEAKRRRETRGKKRHLCYK